MILGPRSLVWNELELELGTVWFSSYVSLSRAITVGDLRRTEHPIRGRGHS